MADADVKIARLRRKLAQRDLRIAGLQRRVASLEGSLASRVLDMHSLPRDVTRAVQEALCNVRMIPMLGIGRSARILEVREVPTDSTPPTPKGAANG